MQRPFNSNNMENAALISMYNHHIHGDTEIRRASYPYTSEIAYASTNGTIRECDASMSAISKKHSQHNQRKVYIGP
jgi:hypothetical protein